MNKRLSVLNLFSRVFCISPQRQVAANTTGTVAANLFSLCKRVRLLPLLLAAIIVFTPYASSAQESTDGENKSRRVSGFVKNERGEPISHAIVLVKGQAFGTTTNDNGFYELIISDNVTLIYSFLGYTPTEVSTRGRNIIDVELREDHVTLEQVVVTGYNTIERQHLATAIETVDVAKMQSRPIAKLQEALGGTVPGVVLFRSSGIPGGGSSINIRGASTLQSTEPLVIVDGLEQSMGDIDPSQVQSMVILKDAASTSMYGSRGANGVVIIETRRGEMGSFKVNVNTWGAVHASIEKPDFVNAYDYMNLKNEAHDVQGLFPAFSVAEIEDAKSGKTPSVDWLKKTQSKLAYTYNATANISGGGGVGRFNLMLGYNDEKGMTRLEGSNKFSARFNTNINLADKFIIMADFYAHRLTVNRGHNGEANTVFAQAWKMNPTQQVYYDAAETGLDIPNHYALYNDINPIAYVNEGGWRKNMYDRITLNIRPRYYITPKLHIAGDLSYMINNNANKFERMTHKFYDANGKPVTVWSHDVGSNQGVSESQLTARGTVNYESRFRGDKDKIYVVAGSEVMSTTYTDYKEYTKASFFAKATYSFADRYIAEVTLRSDGSSKFAPGKQWGFFPSASVAWNLHNEPFMRKLKDSKVINLMKFRFSYGRIGNENVDPYLWQEVVNTWGWTRRVPNPNFSWEKQTQWNFGFDFGILKNRLTGSFDIYKKHSFDLIYSNFPVPPLTGSYDLTTAMNIGEVDNEGWEVSVNWADRIGSDFTYSIGVMLFDNKNTVQKAGHSKDDVLIFKDNVNKIWKRGVPMDNFYGYTTDGYFQTQAEVDDNTIAKFTGTKVGDIKYKDLNDDGVINNKDKVILGDPSPRYNYSINLSLGYKKWDFYALGQGVGKRDGWINGLEGQPVVTDGATNALGTPRTQYMEGRWTPENRNSRFPRMWTGTSPNSHLSDVWMSDASYFRIKAVQLGYTFDKLTKGISKLRIYANAENFLTVTKWEGVEPERIRGGNGSYPMMATYSVGLQVTFF